MEHSKVIEALKELPRWQFILIWVWLMTMAIAPIGWLATIALAWWARK